MSNGTTAFQVSPVDLARIMQEMAEAIIDLPRLKEDIAFYQQANNDLQALNASLRGDMDRLRQDLQQKADALHLLELQNQGTEDELSRTKVQVDQALEIVGARTEELARLQSELQSVKRERDSYGMQHLEVSEALAVANAKLEKFRELLGVDAGPVAPTPVPAPIAPEELDGSGGVELPADAEPTPEVGQVNPTGPQIGSTTDREGGAGPFVSTPSTTTTPDGSNSPASQEGSSVPQNNKDWDPYSGKW